MDSLKVKNAVISKQIEKSQNFEEFLKIIQEKSINLKVMVANSTSSKKIQIENNLYLEFIWPNNLNFVNEKSLNNNSLVCKLHYKSFTALFTGDIEEIAEDKILQKYKNNLSVLNSTVLKVAHHGSNTSSTEDFLKSVNPKIALIGVEKNNKFGHPDNEVLKRLQSIRHKNI